jgi:hypothetical protein
MKMKNKLQNSIDRSIRLLNTPNESENYISIKLSPVPSGCCCFHCWPDTWEKINKSIQPCGPIEDEGNVLIEKNKNKFVLECHESGPEIIAYLALATSSTVLLKSIVDLVITIIKALSNEGRKQPARIKISKRQIVKGKIEEENLIEIDIPISKDLEKQIEDRLKNLINKKP